MSVPTRGIAAAIRIRPRLQRARAGVIAHCALILALAFGCELAAQEGARLGRADYDIIAAALRHGLASDVTLLVLDSETTGKLTALTESGLTLEQTSAELAVTPRVLFDFAARNRRRYAVEPNLTLPVRYELLAPGARAEVFAGDDPAAGWQRFHARFPGAAAVVRVSAPGFDTDTGQALLFVEIHCGPTCGSGRLVSLEHSAEGWRVAAGRLIWMATAAE